MIRGEEPTVRRNTADVVEPLPRSAVVVEQFGGTNREAGESGPILATARRLARHHRRQWQAENASRAPNASAGDIAAAKQLIDELNCRRASLVEELDAWVAAQLCGPPGAPLHTETFGSVVDRLAIAWVRAICLAESDRPRDHARRALGQLAELADAYDDLIRDLAAGRRRLPSWRQLKVYGEQ